MFINRVDIVLLFNHNLKYLEAILMTEKKNLSTKFCRKRHDMTSVHSYETFILKNVLLFS